MSSRTDDLTIDDDEILWRRVIPAWIKEEPGGLVRPGSAAFRDQRSNELSVNIASLTTEEQVLEGRPDDSLVAIRTGVFRGLGYVIVRDPEEGNESHALVCPAPTKRDSRAISRQATWVVLR